MRGSNEARSVRVRACLVLLNVNRHTIFGRIAGSTYFNAQRIGEVEVDKDDRPIEPPRILRIEIIDNPVPDVDIVSM